MVFLERNIPLPATLPDQYLAWYQTIPYHTTSRFFAQCKVRSVSNFKCIKWSESDCEGILVLGCGADLAGLERTSFLDGYTNRN